MLNRVSVERGMKVRFTGTGASEYELARANRHLKAGESYYITDVFKDQWGCYIYVKGVPKQSFKLEMFEDGEAQVKQVIDPEKQAE